MTSAASTLDRDEVAQFDRIATAWWDETGDFAPLHRLNPVRIAYIRHTIEAHFGHTASAAGGPLGGLTLLDVGCGGGLICEPMARLGAQMTGLDAGEANIAAATEHASAQGLAIAYTASTAEALASSGAQFDVVLALEIIEHVADTDLFYDALAALVKPGGLLILSTLNRTAKSYALAIIGAEYVLRWVPRGTHDWNKFIRPSEMAEALGRRRLAAEAPMGLVYHPISGKFSLNSQDLGVNYLLAAKKPE
jgi:2-polyprenyl-6-hydroxyphenyl methylase/3-demethylubiquinone-9 3-methyltransferase